MHVFSWLPKSALLSAYTNRHLLSIFMTSSQTYCCWSSRGRLAAPQYSLFYYQIVFKQLSYHRGELTVNPFELIDRKRIPTYHYLYMYTYIMFFVVFFFKIQPMKLAWGISTEGRRKSQGGGLVPTVDTIFKLSILWASITKNASWRMIGDYFK